MKEGQTLVIDRVSGGFIIRANSAFDALNAAPSTVTNSPMQAWILIGQVLGVDVQSRLAGLPEFSDITITNELPPCSICGIENKGITAWIGPPDSMNVCPSCASRGMLDP